MSCLRISAGVQPQAGEQQPGQGGSGTGDEVENRASPEQLNTSEDEVQQGQGNESEGFQGTGTER